ncbi:MAG TPA: hypothetical protein VNT20_12380 [Flavisolibacter sp.]|nr:hypothetical protein [Flavisolibacter sp.]
MKKLNSVLLFFLASLLLTSCQKELSSELHPQTGGSGTGVSDKTSYSPTTTGTWWKYKDTTSGSISTSSIVNRAKLVSGITYKALVNDVNKTDTGWMASPQPNYYLYVKGVSPNTGASYDMLFHYLNDTASIGNNWHYTAGQGNGFTANIQTTIVERNITMTVAGKTYNNVIHTQLILTYDIFGTDFDAMMYDYFTAKGIGVIKVRSEGLSLLSGFKACSDLIDYSIK